MKKYLSLLIILCMFFVTLPSVTAENEGAIPSESNVNLIFGLNLVPHINYSEYSADTKLTRAELAWVLNNIKNYKNDSANQDDSWQFYGNGDAESEELKIAYEKALPRFSDVSESHWAYETVELAALYGLMKGVSEDMFMPDRNVTAPEIAKTLVCLMGYESKAMIYGGYPEGFLRMADELKILDGINRNSEITNGALIQILANCLEVNMFEMEEMFSEDGKYKQTYTKSNETFLSYLLGLGKIKGTMTDNSITSLYGKSEVREGQFVISGNLLYADSEIRGSLLDYIGRNIVCYYHLPDDKNTDNYIVYAALTNRDEVIVIEADEYRDYDGSSIHYYDKESDKNNSESISGFYNLIYNGRAITSYDKTIFDISEGTITVVHRVDSDVDVVIINSFATWFTSAVDYNGEKVYNRLQLKGENGTLDLSELDEVMIYKPGGEKGTINDISSSMVLDVSANDKTATIFISDNSKVITAQGVSTVSGTTYVTADGEKLPVSKRYSAYSEKLKITPGEEYTIYLNKAGEIAWVVKGEVGGIKAGFITAAEYDTAGVDNSVKLLLCDTDSKAVREFKINESKITVSNSYGTEKSYKNITEFVSDHIAYRGLVRFKTDENDNITYIEYPILDLRFAVEGKLTLICETDDNTYYRFNNIGGKATIKDGQTTVFCYDPAFADPRNDVIIQNPSDVFSNEKQYAAKCYTTKKNSKASEYVTYETTDLKEASIIFSYNNKPKIAVAKKIYQGYDDEFGTVMQIEAFSFTSADKPADVTLSVLDSVVPTTIMKHPFTGDLEPGDLFVYGTDKDGAVNEIRIIWDENGVNPASPSGAPGRLTDSKGYFGTGDDAPTYSTSNVYTGDLYNIPNPYNISTNTSNNEDQIKTSKSFYTGPYVFYYGFANNFKDGAIELTTQDLTVNEFDEYGEDGKHILRVWAEPSNIISVNLSGVDRVDTAYGANNALNAIKTKQDYKGECSRIITISALAQLNKLIVINGSFK